RFDLGGPAVVAVVCPGVERSVGAVVVRPRVLGVAKPPEKALASGESPAASEADLAPKPEALITAEAASSSGRAITAEPASSAGAAIEALAPPAEPPASLPASEPPPAALPQLERTTPFALLPAPKASVLSLLDLSAETAIGPEEAAAAAAAAARVPRVVADDAQVKDEALAAVGTEPVYYELDDSDVEEIHQLVYPVPTESKPG